MPRSCAFCDGEFPSGDLRSLDSTVLCSACHELASPSNGANGLAVRPIQRDDLELVLAWRNNPTIYEHFVEQDGPLRWEDHVRWFESRPPARRDYVTRYDGRRIGVVGVDESGFVTVYIGEPALWGEGIGTKLLNWLTARHDPERDLHAEIHVDNDRSRRLFERCGFEHVNRDTDWDTYQYVSER